MPREKKSCTGQALALQSPAAAFARGGGHGGRIPPHVLTVWQYERIVAWAALRGVVRKPFCMADVQPQQASGDARPALRGVFRQASPSLSFVATGRNPCQRHDAAPVP